MMREEKMKNALRHAIDARLSGVALPETRRESVLRALNEKEKRPMKTKVTISLVAAIIALILTTTALALGALRFGVLDLNPGQKENQEYVQHIIGVDKTYDNEYFTMTINEAVFDGTYMSLAMNITPKEGRPGDVFIMPHFEAESSGHKLGVDIESCTGDFFSGFWVPDREKSVDRDSTAYGVDVTIYDLDKLETAQSDSPVTWRAVFHVLRPEWPVTVDNGSTAASGNAGRTEVKWQARYRGAYERKEILTGTGGELMEYAAYAPIPETMSEDEYFALPVEERLVAIGAFTEVDTLTAEFVTDGVKTGVWEPQSFEMGEYIVTVDEIAATFSRLRVAATVSAKEGDLHDMLAQSGETIHFAVFADGVKTGHCALSSWSAAEEGDGDTPVYNGQVVCIGEYELTGIPDTVTLCLRKVDHHTGNVDTVMDAELPAADDPERRYCVTLTLPETE